MSLQRLGHVTGETRFLQAAERSLLAFQGQLAAHPSAFCSLLLALQEQIQPPTLVILRGDADGMREWERALAAAPDPGRLVLSIPPGMAGLPATLDKPWSGGVNAWVCRGVTCKTSVSEASGLLASLREPAWAASSNGAEMA